MQPCGEESFILKIKLQDNKDLSLISLPHGSDQLCTYRIATVYPQCSGVLFVDCMQSACSVQSSYTVAWCNCRCTPYFGVDVHTLHFGSNWDGPNVTFSCI